VIVAPPLDAGAVQDTTIWVFPAVPVTAVGAPGTVAGVTAEEIRTTADLRSRLKTGMSEISTKLDAMVITMPRRKFRPEE